MVRERDVFEIRMFEIQMFLLMLMYRECVGTSEIVRDREYFDIRVFEISRFYCNTNKLNNKNTSIKKWTAYSFPSNSESHA